MRLSYTEKQGGDKVLGRQCANTAMVLLPVVVQDHHGGSVLNSEPLRQDRIGLDADPDCNEMVVHELNNVGIWIRTCIHLPARTAAWIEKIQHHLFLLDTSH